MTLYETISKDWVSSVKAKDNQRKKVLAYIRSKLQARAKNTNVAVLPDADSVKVLRRMEKEQKEFVELTKEDSNAVFELKVIQAYLPTMLSELETKDLVFAYISSLDFIPTSKDMGKVMGPIMKKHKEVADGALIRKFVIENLKK